MTVQELIEELKSDRDPIFRVKLSQSTSALIKLENLELVHKHKKPKNEASKEK